MHATLAVRDKAEVKQTKQIVDVSGAIATNAIQGSQLVAFDAHLDTFAKRSQFDASCFCMILVVRLLVPPALQAEATRLAHRRWLLPPKAQLTSCPWPQPWRHGTVKSNGAKKTRFSSRVAMFADPHRAEPSIAPVFLMAETKTRVTSCVLRWLIAMKYKAIQRLTKQLKGSAARRRCNERPNPRRHLFVSFRVGLLTRHRPDLKAFSLDCIEQWHFQRRSSILQNANAACGWLTAAGPSRSYTGVPCSTNP